MIYITSTDRPSHAHKQVCVCGGPQGCQASTRLLERLTSTKTNHDPKHCLIVIPSSVTTWARLSSSALLSTPCTLLVKHICIADYCGSSFLSIFWNQCVLLLTCSPNRKHPRPELACLCAPGSIIQHYQRSPVRFLKDSIDHPRGQPHGS